MYLITPTFCSHTSVSFQCLIRSGCVRATSDQGIAVLDQYKTFISANDSHKLVSISCRAGRRGDSVFLRKSVPTLPRCLELMSKPLQRNLSVQIADQ